jgi:tetratricopeptide (TPR) repeat protein
MPSLFQKLFRKQGNEDYNAGIALYNEGRFSEAIEKFELAVASAPVQSTTYRLGTFYAAEAHANIGRSLVKASEHAASIKHFERAIEETPHFPDLQYNLGVARFMTGDVQGAQLPFEKALEINSGYVEARCFLAVVKDTLGLKSESREDLKHVLEEHSEIPISVNKFLLVHLKERETLIPEIGPVLELLDSNAQFREVYSEGIAQFNLRNYDLAAGLLEQASTMKPHYADVQCQLGLARYKGGETVASIEEFRQSLEINPRFLEAAFFLGMALFQEERYLEAETAFEKAHNIRAEATDVLYHLALCKIHLGKNIEAESILRRVIEFKPTFAQALYSLGLLRFEDGDIEAGMSLLKDALSINPHLTEAERDLGLMYIEQEQWDSAEELFQRMGENHPEDPDLYCFVGRSHLGRGNLEAACADFERALSQSPDNLYALQGLSRCYVKMGRPEKAQPLLDRALKANPGFPDLWKLQGALYFKSSRYSEAETSYRNAIEGAPRDPEAKLALALVLRNLGRNEEAATIIRELQKLYPDQLELRKILSAQFVDLDEIP